MSHIIIIVSVDWEGRSLLHENLEIMNEFRMRHKDIPMQLTTRNKTQISLKQRKI